MESEGKGSVVDSPSCCQKEELFVSFNEQKIGSIVKMHYIELVLTVAAFCLSDQLLGEPETFNVLQEPLHTSCVVTSCLHAGILDESAQIHFAWDFGR